MRMIRTSILSLLLAGALCFCFRIQELLVEMCVDSVVSSIVYTSTVERYGDGKGGSLEGGGGQRSITNRL